MNSAARNWPATVATNSSTALSTEVATRYILNIIDYVRAVVLDEGSKGMSTINIDLWT